MGHDDHYIYLNRLISEKETERGLNRIAYGNLINQFYQEKIKPLFQRKKTIENSVN